MSSIKIGGVTFIDSPYMEGARGAVQIADDAVAVSPAMLSLIESGDIEQLRVIDMRTPDLTTARPIEWEEPDNIRAMKWRHYFG